MSAIRLFRIARLFRLLRFLKGLNKLFNAFLDSIWIKWCCKGSICLPCGLVREQRELAAACVSIAPECLLALTVPQEWKRWVEYTFLEFSLGEEKSWVLLEVDSGPADWTPPVAGTITLTQDSGTTFKVSM